jgi:filamentous hemagglutinin family protein
MKLKSSCIILLSINSLSTNAEVTLDGTLGRGGTLPGPDYLIGADLGRQHGGNLFHSFQGFNLQSHESATFSGPNSVSNIISRVTGGNPSQIDGLIRSTIPNADMYFLNPYGIMFGPNARLDVQGSFHASTADYLRLGDGGRFDARNHRSSLLTIAPIESFGFLNRQVAPISIQGHGEVTQDWVINQSTGLNVRKGKTLSLIGGQIDMWMGTFFKTMTIDDEGNESTEITRLPTISAPFGRINLASVASQGEVKLGGDFVDISSFSQLADIHIKKNSLLRTSGEGGGNIFIRGGQFFADDSAIEGKTLGSKDGGVIDIRAGAISLTNGATLNGNTEGSSRGTDILLHATDSIMAIGDASDIYADSGIPQKLTSEELGDGGKISLKDGASISANTSGGGNGSDVTLRATDSVTFSESDKNATKIHLFTFSKDESAGDGGHLLIEAKNISLENGAMIDVSPRGEGNGGNVTLHAGNMLKLTGVGKNHDRGSQILTSANNVGNTDGDSGDIFVKAQDVLLADGAYLNSETFGSGKAGNVHVHATGTITIAGANKKGWRSMISSGSTPTPVGKGITGGEGGNVTIEADQLIIKDGGGIAASSIAPNKNIQSSRGGHITIRVQGAVELSGVNPYGENKDGFGSGIYARSSGVKNNAGDAGSIKLQAGSLIIRDGAVIRSSTNNNAKGGNIDIDVRDTITITGDASNILLKEPAFAQKVYLQFSPSNYNQSISGIYARSDSKTEQAGQGGNISLIAQNLTLTDTGKISVSSAGGGDAGQIVVNADQLRLANGGRIATASLSSGGGSIEINAEGLVFLEKSLISTSVRKGAGNGGDLTISEPQFVVLNNGRIIAKAYEGHGGNINIKSDHFMTSPNSLINASSRLGIDGKVKIDSPDTDMEGFFVVLPGGFVESNQLQSPCSSRIAENQNRFVIVSSEGTSNAVNDLLPSGPPLSQIKPIKTTKSMTGKDTMAKPAVKVALLAGCQPNLSEPPAHVRKIATRKRRAVKRSRVIPEEPLF